MNIEKNVNNTEYSIPNNEQLEKDLTLSDDESRLLTDAAMNLLEMQMEALEN